MTALSHRKIRSKIKKKCPNIITIKTIFKAKGIRPRIIQRECGLNIYRETEEDKPIVCKKCRDDMDRLVILDKNKYNQYKPTKRLPIKFEILNYSGNITLNELLIIKNTLGERSLELLLLFINNARTNNHIFAIYKLREKLGWAQLTINKAKVKLAMSGWLSFESVFLPGHREEGRNKQQVVTIIIGKINAY